MNSYDQPFAVPRAALIERLKHYLDIDIGFGDLTSGVIPSDARSKARIMAKSDGIVAGVEEAKALFEYFDVSVTLQFCDSDTITKGQSLMELEGPTRNMLIIERTALDFLMKLSSIATSTYEMVSEIRKHKYATILATTRKVTPGFGWFEKKAVAIGGGDPHRWNLSDMVLLKNTHLKYYRGNIEQMIAKAKVNAGFSKKIEIEIEQPADISRAIKAGADIIMVDNMTPEEITKLITNAKEEFPHTHVMFEASGNITHDNYLKYAATGVDVISTSELILHPPKHMDYSLRLQ